LVRCNPLTFGHFLPILQVAEIKRAPNRPRVGPKLPTARYDEGRPTGCTSSVIKCLILISLVQTSGPVYLTCILLYAVQMYNISRRDAEVTKIIYFAKNIKIYLHTCQLLE